MRIFILLFFLISIVSCGKYSENKKDFRTLFETSKGTETPEYKDVISFYKDLSEEYSNVSLFTFGQTDSGEPLHLVVYNREGVDNLEEIKKID